MLHRRTVLGALALPLLARLAWIERTERWKRARRPGPLAGQVGAHDAGGLAGQVGAHHAGRCHDIAGRCLLVRARGRGRGQGLRPRKTVAVLAAHLVAGLGHLPGLPGRHPVAAL